MTQSVNWAELMSQSGGAFEPVPKGTYDVFVEQCEATRSSTDKLMFKIRFKIEGGPFNGRTLYNNITLTTDNVNATRMFFLNMKALGLGQEYFANNPIPEQVAAALINQRATVIVDHRLYQGQMRENVKTIMPRAGGVVAGVGAVPSVQVAPSIVPGGPQIPTPGSNPSPVPQMPGAAPVVSQPASPVVPSAPIAPPPVESSVPIPAPQNPAPPATPAPNLISESGSGEPSNEPVAATAPVLPPGMTPEMYQQFMAFQASQNAPKIQESGAPAGAPPFPLPDGEAF